MNKPRHLRPAAHKQAQAMLAVLERRRPGAADRLSHNAYGELATWPDLQLINATEPTADPGSCSVAGSYRDDVEPPALVVAASASPRRRQFTALHELGHHLQRTDDDLGEQTLQVDESVEFEDLACDAFASRILLSDDAVNRHIGSRGPTADAVVGLYRTSQASRAACCVRAAERLVAPGAVVLYTTSGTVSFASARGDFRPPARGTDQSSTPLLQRALPRLHSNDEALVVCDRTTVMYRNGSRREGVYSQAAACDGYIVAVLTAHDPAWRTFAPPRADDWSAADDGTWVCETCHENFAKDESCPTCRQPRCPNGHCGCTMKTELVCTRCFMSRHRTQFASGSTTCRDCTE